MAMLPSYIQYPTLRGSRSLTGGWLVSAIAIAVSSAAHSAHAQETRGWSIDPALDVSARAATSQSAIRDDEEVIIGDAIAFGLAPSVRFEKGDTVITIRNSLKRVEYFSDDRTDRWQNIASITADQAFSDRFAVRAFAERGDNVPTAEFFRADQWEVGGRVETEFDDANRVRLGASWRERDYDDVARSHGEGPQIDGEYRYRFGANHYLYARGRYEEIDSVEDARRMNRQSAFLVYQIPVAKDLRLRPELSYRDLEYPGRALPEGGFRRDEIVSPEVTAVYRPGPWQVSAEAKYIWRESNDPRFDRGGYRFAIEVGYEF